MSEDFNDFLIDSKLNIKTTGRDDKHSDVHRYPYEPTSYSVLDRMIRSGYLSREDTLLDYGCGMGRVPIYLHHILGCRGIGIELVEEFYQEACKNKERYRCEDQICFANGKAEAFEVPLDVTACFFFNPFDLGILRGVMKKILASFDESPRTIRLFFYYPQDEYMAFLSTIPGMTFVDEIDCTDLFAAADDRNRVMIFEFTGI